MQNKRYAFISLTAALCLSAVSVLSILPSHAGAASIEPPISPQEQDADSVNSQAAAAVIPNNTLIHAVGSDALLLDPALAYDTSSSAVLIQIYDPLLELKREKVDEFVPMLATGWSISPDGKTYIFNIRQGVKFHNGGTLDAIDVAYTFQRAILQGGSNSPQWLYNEAIFGVGYYDICDLIPEDVCDSRLALQAYQAANPVIVSDLCVYLKTRIVPNTYTGTVTFNLYNAWGPFLNTLAGKFGLIIDKEWAVAQGAWDGNCSTWHNYYTATSANSPLRSATNGTGPFKLAYWNRNVEMGLIRFDNYWNTTPLWPGGPVGPAVFDTVTRSVVANDTTRSQMLLDGDVDLIDGSGSLISELDGVTLFHFTQPDGITPTLKKPGGTLNKFTGGLSTAANDAFFTYDIATDGARNYIGSGTWDGHGIPPNFFNDIHVRQGFNYAFDWDAYIDTVFGGNAFQRTGPIIKPLPGFDESQSHYSYNPSLALFHLNQAHAGLIETTGFSLTVAYPTGSLPAQTVANILKTNIEALNPEKFHIDVISLDWSTFLSEMNRGRVPLFVVGWMQDIPHAHNWVQPYLIGGRANSQRIPTSQQEIYEQMVNQCVALSDSAAETCYEVIQNQTYLDALDIFLAQGWVRAYTSAYVQGYYINPARPAPRYYDLYKNPLPETVTVTPDEAQTLVFTPTLDVDADLAIPAGSVLEEVQIAAISEVRLFAEPMDFLLGDIAFDLHAFLPDGTIIPDMSFENPVILTIYYGEGKFTPEQELGLQLLYFDGTAWVDASCGMSGIDPVNHTINVPICHLSSFALAEPNHPIYMPVIRR